MMTAQAQPEPNRAILRQHIERITMRWPELGIPVVLEIRMLFPGKSPQVARFDVADPQWFEECLDYIENLNKMGRNAYACVNPVDPAKVSPGDSGASDAAIAAAFFQFIDCDDQAATDNYANFTGPARAFNVMTGTIPFQRPHIYWELEQPQTDMAEWRKLQIALAARFRSDGVVINPSRIMRLAGTVTYPDEKKQAKGYVSEVAGFGLKVQGEPVSFERLRALFPDTAKPAPGQSDTDGAFTFDVGEERSDLADALSRCSIDGQKHGGVRDATAILAARGNDKQTIEAIVKNACPVWDDNAQNLVDTAAKFAPAITTKNFDHTPAEQGSAEAPESSGWKLQSAADFISDFVAPEYLIEGVAQRGNIYTLTAPTGSGKTAAMLYASAAIATGQQFCGLEAERGSVLFLAGENPDDVRARVIATLDHYEIDAADCNLNMIAGTFSIRQDMEALKAAAARLPDLALIVVDTFAAYFDGEDENSNAQALDFVQVLRGLTRLPSRPSVIVPAHPVKNATRNNLTPKGGSSVVNEVDGNLTLWNEAGIVTMHWQYKHRGPDFDPLKIELHKIENPKIHDKHGRIMPSVVAGPISEMRAMELASDTLSREDKVLLSIATDPAISVVERCARLGFVNGKGNAQKSSIQRVFDRLFKQKLIKRFRSNWELTGDGEKAVDMIRSGEGFSLDLDQ